MAHNGRWLEMRNALRRGTPGAEQMAARHMARLRAQIEFGDPRDKSARGTHKALEALRAEGARVDNGLLGLILQGRRAREEERERNRREIDKQFAL